MPNSVAIAPDGRSAYVAAASGGNPGDALVWQYDITAAGTPAPKTPASVANGRFPLGIAVSQFDVDAAGRLTPKATPSLAAGNGPSTLRLRVTSADGQRRTASAPLRVRGLR